MMKIFYTMLVILLLFGCKEKEQKVPEEELVSIISDLLIADELIIKYGQEASDESKYSLKKKILERYNYEEVAFDSMMVEVQRDLKYYHHIQGLVGDRLAEIKDETLGKSKDDK